MKRNVITLIVALILVTPLLGQGNHEQNNYAWRYGRSVAACDTADKVGLTVFEWIPLNGKDALGAKTSFDFLPLTVGIGVSLSDGRPQSHGFQLGSVRFYDKRDGSGQHSYGSTYIGVDLLQVCWDKGRWHREAVTFGVYTEFFWSGNTLTRRYTGAHFAYRVGFLSANVDLTIDNMSKFYFMISVPIGSMARKAM